MTEFIAFPISTCSFSYKKAINPPETAIIIAFHSNMKLTPCPVVNKKASKLSILNSQTIHVIL